MNFYYHPIFGLQYSCKDPLFIINMSAIPKNLDIDKIMNLIHQQGIHFVNPTNEHWVNHISSITSNINLN